MYLRVCIYFRLAKCVSIASHVIALLTAYCLFWALQAFRVWISCLLALLGVYCLFYRLFRHLKVWFSYINALLRTYCLFKASQAFKSLIFLCFCFAEPERIMPLLVWPLLAVWISYVIALLRTYCLSKALQAFMCFGAFHFLKLYFIYFGQLLADVLCCFRSTDNQGQK